MDTPTLKKLLTRAVDNIDAALASIEAGHPEYSQISIRAALAILSYIETKQALAGELATTP